MTTIIQILGIASTGEVADGGPYWLKMWDVDADDGRGTFTSTRDPAEAWHFVDRESAFQAWRSQSTVRPLRDDGQPNRPLTAFTVLFDEAL